MHPVINEETNLGNYTKAVQITVSWLEHGDTSIGKKVRQLMS
jgi:hypothetical protein